MQPTITELLVGLLALKRSKLYKRTWKWLRFRLDVRESMSNEAKSTFRSLKNISFDTAKMTLDTERI